MTQEKKDFKEQLAEAASKLNIELNEDSTVSSQDSDPESEFLISLVSPLPNDRKARAPYNFVPLNSRVVAYRTEEGRKFQNGYKEELKTGYMELTIRSLTPLYIRDNKLKDSDPDVINPEFYGELLGTKRIPGSSLRGMTRSLLEIASFGKFNFFDDKRLYMRGLADKSNSLRDDYQNRMIDKAQNFFPKVAAGYLLKKGRHYQVHPCLKDANGEQFYKVAFDKRTGSINGLGISIPEYSYRDVWFQQVQRKDHKHQRRVRGQVKSYLLRYALVTNLSLSRSLATPIEGQVYNSGSMQNKHFHWILNVGDPSIVLPVNRVVMEDYKNDDNRKSIDIFEKAASGPHPCFYITDDNGHISAIGHTAMFRIPYDLSIGQHVMEYLKSGGVIDFSESIFGKTEDFAGRVFFEDAFLNDEQRNCQSIGISTPKILSGPKPTTFQHYLCQERAELNEVRNYNPDDTGKVAAIRGYKLYWHRSENSWQENGNVPEDSTQHTKINPIIDGCFRSRIRFENLTKEELGGLLFVLDLPDDCAHKIGMGKPLGLGSIKIDVTLHLSQRQKRYRELYFEFSGDIPFSENEGQRVDSFKRAFAEHIVREASITLNGKTDSIEVLWDSERMAELRRLLDFNNKPADSQTSYMTITPQNEFKDRRVLPKPTDVK